MAQIKLKINGVNDLLMHDNKGANPLGVYAKASKANRKRNRTDDDYEFAARLDWESGLYFQGGMVVMPARCIEKCFLMGARKSKIGKQYESGVFMEDQYSELKYRGTKITAKKSEAIPNPELDKFYEEHRDISMVKVGTSMIPRCRPVFYDWSFECTLNYEPEIINKEDLIKACTDAGRLVGLLEQRPRKGRFTVEVLK